MAATFNFRSMLSFLDALSKHNNKAWFDKNRVAYEDARDTFEHFIDYLIDEFRTSDHLKDLSAKQCVSRINRDIRFSKDKSPYKTNLGATIAPDGRKSMQLGYHVSIGPHGHSLIAGGLYMPTPDQLGRFRKAVAQDATELKKIARAKAFVDQFGKIEGEKLKTAPQGYDRDHPEIELLQLKQVTVIHHFSDKEVLSSEYREWC
jgi:uncharacterized protein (TIGR02453 family)